jgi:DNA polymerase III sliding clamp (beta) subunit (PCNA family)
MIKISTKELQEALNFLQLAVGTSAVDSERSKCLFLKSVREELFAFTSTQNVSISYKIKEWVSETTGSKNTSDEIDMGFDAKKFKHLVDTNTKENITLVQEMAKVNDENNNPVQMLTWKMKGRGNYKIQNFKFDFEDTFYNEDLGEPIFTITSKEISDAMERSIFFVSEERQDPHLRHFYFDGNLVAADRKSIHIVETSLKDNIETKMLIPQIFYDICKKFNSDTITAYNLNSYYIFTDGVYRVRIPMISGSDKFPNYSVFVDSCKDNPNSIEFDKDSLKSVIATLSFFTADQHYNSIEFDIKKDKVHFKVHNDDILDEEIDCKTSGEEMNIRLNSKYLKKITEIFDHDRIKILLGDFKSAVYLADSKSKIILAPIAVKKD